MEGIGVVKESVQKRQAVTVVIAVNLHMIIATEIFMVIVGGIKIIMTYNNKILSLIFLNDAENRVDLKRSFYFKQVLVLSRWYFHGRPL